MAKPPQLPSPIDAPIVSPSFVRARYDATQVSSRRTRDREERDCLASQGTRIVIYALQGELRFASCELVIRAIVASQSAVDYVILDLRRVISANPAVGALISQLAAQWQNGGKHLLLASERQSPIRQQLAASAPLYDDYDSALEWCENHLLARVLPARAGPGAVALADFELCHGLPAASLAQLARLLEPQSYAPGETIIRAGDPPDYLYFLTSGGVDVLVTSANGQATRVTTIAAGLVFGEMAIIDRAPRSAIVVANSPVSCLALSLAAYDGLEEQDPILKLALLGNMTRRLSNELRKAMREIAAFS